MKGKGIIMKVILQIDLKGTGKKGQLVEVSDGYARNYLLPRKLVLEANNQNLNVMKTQAKAKEHHISESKTSALEIKEKLLTCVLEISAKAGSGGRLFGSVTTKEIAEELLKVYKIEIDKRKIILNEPIKAFGDFSVEVKLYTDVVGIINVRVKGLDILHTS